MGYYAFYDGFGKEDGREGSSRGRKVSWKYFKEGGLKNSTFRQMWKQDFARIRLRISVDFWLSLKLTRNYWDLLNSQRNIQFCSLNIMEINLSRFELIVSLINIDKNFSIFFYICYMFTYFLSLSRCNINIKYYTLFYEYKLFEKKKKTDSSWSILARVFEVEKQNSKI